MQTIDISEASKNFAAIVDQVIQGKEFTISLNGEPVAILQAYKPTPRRVGPPGRMEGKIWMSEDFNDPIDDLFDCLKDE